MSGQFESAAHAGAGTAEQGLRLGEAGPVVFRHNVATSYDDLGSIAGIDLYSGRVLCGTRPDDVIHLPEALQEDYGIIQTHYGKVGLAVAQKVLWTMTHDPSAYPEYPRSDFLFSAEAMAATPNERRLRSVERYNDKNWFVRMAQVEGLPIPPTTTHEKGEMPKQEFDGPWFVKGAVAASGTQVIGCKTWEEVEAVAASYGAKHDYQVQGHAGTDVFLNVQYNAHNGRAAHVATTEQVMDGFTHNGNRHPSQFDPREVTDPVANQAAEAGIDGVFAFDVAATPNDPKNPYKFIECNPRPNGSTYFTVTAERLGVTDWMGVNLHTGKPLAQSVKALHESGLAHDPNTGTGVTIVNWGTAPDGKLGVLLSGPPEVQDEHRRMATKVLAA